MVSAGQVHTTKTAFEGGAALECDFDDMLAVIQARTLIDFYESMTMHTEHLLW